MTLTRTIDVCLCAECGHFVEPDLHTPVCREVSHADEDAIATTFVAVDALLSRLEELREAEVARCEMGQATFYNAAITDAVTFLNAATGTGGAT